MGSVFFCNLISICEWRGKIVDFKTLNQTMPELGRDNLIKPWKYDTIPRIVKTHKHFWSIFQNHKIILIVREPRDVMVSYYHFETAKAKPRFRGTFSEFIRHKKFGLEAWFKHYQSWIKYATVLLTYEDLKKDDISEFSRMLKCLDISIDPEIVKLAAEKSRFDQIRQIEDEYGWSMTGKFKQNSRFTRQGKSQAWQDFFSLEDLDYFRTLREKFQ